MIRIDGISKSFGGVHAVKDASLDARPGEVHALIGPNGAGKSTFLNVLAGVYRPDSGHVILGGDDVTRRSAVWRARRGLGRSFQGGQLIDDLTVRENLWLAAGARRRQSRLRRDEIEAWLDRLDLARRATDVAGSLPHGSRMLLEIARAMLIGQVGVVLDEPTAGLSRDEKDRVATLLRRECESRFVILVEHDIDFVFAVSDRVTVLVAGSVLVCGEPAAIRADQDVINAYLGSDLGASVAQPGSPGHLNDGSRTRWSS